MCGGVAKVGFEFEKGDNYEMTVKNKKAIPISNSSNFTDLEMEIKKEKSKSS